MSPAELVQAATERPATVTFRKGTALDAVIGFVQWDLSTREFLVVRTGGNGAGANDVWIARRFILMVKFTGSGADAHRLDARREE